jgi:hypothetical protein
VLITLVVPFQSQQQVEDSNQSDSDEEPSPEALARYLAMRRHTVGVGDAQHELPEDARTKLAQHQPLVANPHHPHFVLAPFPQLPEMNLPQHIPLATPTPTSTSATLQPLPIHSHHHHHHHHHNHHPMMAVYDHNLLLPPTAHGKMEWLIGWLVD